MLELSRIPKSAFELPDQLVESELPDSIGGRTKRELRILGSDPSPGPLRLVKAPAADPLPNGEGWNQSSWTALSRGERVARVASQVRGFSSSSLATTEFGIIK
ncbi:hypothetical protein SBA2_300008 [Acidobacteriia bacterium SbA2]|nr:hypothetical protein SBA2_300008 [Acidobacteriia bacterium SbA2]